MLNLNWNILIVEEDWFSAEFLRITLVDIGFSTIYLIRDSTDALEFVVHHRIDFIICDYRMLNVSGVRLLEKLRNHSNPQIRNIPTIFVTGYLSEISQREAFKLGVRAVIIKPITKEMLKEAMESNSNEHT